MLFRLIYDDDLAQAAYLIGCQKTREAIVIDPERDVQKYIDLAAEHGLTITDVAETHIHADFLSGARELSERTQAHVHVSGEGGPDWQSRWVGNYPSTQHLDGDQFSVGGIEFTVIYSPGHTPEHVSYLVRDLGRWGRRTTWNRHWRLCLCGRSWPPGSLGNCCGYRGHRTAIC